MRALCPTCNALIQADVPRGGDGSAVLLRRHTLGRRWYSAPPACRGSKAQLDRSQVLEAGQGLVEIHWSAVDPEVLRQARILSGDQLERIRKRLEERFLAEIELAWDAALTEAVRGGPILE